MSWFSICLKTNYAILKFEQELYAFSSIMNRTQTIGDIFT
jgi:hypothetical protein